MAGARRTRGAPPSPAWPDRPWVESDQLQARLNAIGADPDLRRFAADLARDGVAVIDLGAEGRALCDRAVADTERYFDAPGANRVQDAWLRSRAVRRLATDPKVLDYLGAVYGRPAFPFQTLNFKYGTQQATHSDAIHFHSEPERFMCGVWTALEDIGPDSGPLDYVVGSHALPVLTMRGAGVNDPAPAVEDYGRVYIPALAARLEASGLPHARAVLKKGQALVWAANLAHGGAPIANPVSTRRSLVTHYFFKGCVYYTPMTSDVEAGRLSVRLPPNASTGLFEWPRRQGAPVLPPPGQVIDTVKKLALGRPVY